MNSNKTVYGAGVILMLCMLSGCHPGILLIGAYERDVSRKDDLWGGYLRGQRYCLVEDVFLCEAPHASENPSFQYAIVPPDVLAPCPSMRHYSSAERMEDYFSDPLSYPSIISILKKGTEIQSAKLIKRGTLLIPGHIKIYAEIIDGPCKGILADMQDISITSFEGRGDRVCYSPSGILQPLNEREKK